MAAELALAVAESVWVAAESVAASLVVAELAVVALAVAALAVVEMAVAEIGAFDSPLRRLFPD